MCHNSEDFRFRRYYGTYTIYYVKYPVEIGNINPLIFLGENTLMFPTKFLPHMSLNQILLQMSFGTKLRGKQIHFQSFFSIFELQIRDCGPVIHLVYCNHISFFPTPIRLVSIFLKCNSWPLRPSTIWPQPAFFILITSQSPSNTSLSIRIGPLLVTQTSLTHKSLLMEVLSAQNTPSPNIIFHDVFLTPSSSSSLHLSVIISPLV